MCDHGRCHHIWMDQMKRLGIKQAAYVVDYVFEDRVGFVQVKKTTFLREYYRHDTQIKVSPLCETE